ncbi:hypothetical protein [Micromonospora trifolii]|uniref:hypothetical protein n=1 Tax=Micromonospora trifolii TaxID=2911208 RepID=UPI003CE93C38
MDVQRSMVGLRLAVGLRPTDVLRPVVRLRLAVGLRPVVGLRLIVVSCLPVVVKAAPAPGSRSP